MPHRIAIIGAGFSGTATALAVHRAAREPAQVRVFDERTCFGPGIAYDTESPLHLLNVPPSNLGVLAEEPEAFEAWLRSRVSARATYLPRTLYGRYLEECFDRSLNDPSTAGLVRVPARVDRVARENGTFRLYTASGDEYGADAVVLASGYAAPTATAQALLAERSGRSRE